MTIQDNSMQVRNSDFSSSTMDLRISHNPKKTITLFVPACTSNTLFLSVKYKEQFFYFHKIFLLVWRLQSVYAYCHYLPWLQNSQ